LELDFDYELARVYPNYNYKRWIWMQLPWLALDVDSDVSKKLNKLINRQLTIAQERAIYLKITKIAIDVKNQK
jgi:hypothetical protein